MAIFYALSGSASAQSVLERVLGQINSSTNLAPVNGTFANIAESIGTPDVTSTVTTTTSEDVPVGLADAPSSTGLWNLPGGDIRVSDIGTTYTAGDTTNYIASNLEQYGIDSLTVNSDGSLTINAATSLGSYQFYNYSTEEAITVDAGLLSGASYTLAADAVVYDFSVSHQVYYLQSPSIAVGKPWEGAALTQTVTTTTTEFATIPGLSTVIDGSITNVVTGVTAATQDAVAGVAAATEWVAPAVDLGDMSTTVLGAVNTGDITLGVNQSVDEAATSTTNAISAAVAQIGGSADTGALVLNVAHNASAVNGSIQNTMTAVNGSVGNLSTTTLGAVNTGTITSGVNAAVAGIVGMSGQTGL